MRFAVVVFPGSNCDADAVHAVRDVLGEPCDMVWHRDTDLSKYDCIILPGGFAYGDYLRTGAIASQSPVMHSVRQHAEQGKPVLGVCNGFQILCESGLLPGALQRNDHLRFSCAWRTLRVERTNTPFTNQCQVGQVLRIPEANGEGNYFADTQTLQELESEGRVVLRYCTADGQATPEACPNGSVHNIAGIVNKRGNVMGMMPHPERAMEAMLGGADGKAIFSSLVNYLVGRPANAC